AWALRVVGARLEQAEPAAPLDERLAAAGARLGEHLRALARLAVLAHVRPVIAVGVARARDERPVASGPLDQLAFPTLRALLAGELGFGLGIALDVLAFRVAGAADELSVAPGAQLERTPARRAHLVEELRLLRLAFGRERAAELALRVARAAHERAEAARLADEMSLVAQRADLVGVGGGRLLGGAEHPLQRAVEVLHHRHPFLVAALHIVEALLELRRVVVVGDALEVVDHQGVDRFADTCREKPAVLDLDVPVRLGDRLHDWRVGGRTADAALLQLLDERRLRVAGRRLREVLLGLEAVVVEVLALGERGQLVLAILVPSPHLVEAVECEDRAVGAEDVLAAIYLDLGLVVDGRRHTARHKAAPDEVVQPVLVGSQVLANRLWRAVDLSRPDRLV